MDFFKSVLSHTAAAEEVVATPDPSIPPTPTAPPAFSWTFGSNLFQTLASKSGTLIDNYYKDFQEFSTGLKKETLVIRQVASRAVQNLPTRLESGAAIAQESLEAVGQVIDNVGATVSDIIGKDLNFVSGDVSTSTRSIAGNRDLNLTREPEPKTYNRLEAIIRALQCDIHTYSDEVEENDYLEWKMGFQIEEKKREMEQLVEENGVIMKIYNEIVPLKVDEEAFWCRYFYRTGKVIQADEARARILKKAILGHEDDELSWDFDCGDDNDDNCNTENGEHKLEDDVENKGVDILVDDGLGVKLIDSEKEVSDGKLGSDISIISSQRTSHAEDDLAWDKIEDIVSGDENKINKAVDLHKHLNSCKKECDDEELTWDLEDDDDEHVK